MIAEFIYDFVYSSLLFGHGFGVGYLLIASLEAIHHSALEIID